MNGPLVSSLPAHLSGRAESDPMLSSSQHPSNMYSHLSYQDNYADPSFMTSNGISSNGAQLYGGGGTGGLTTPLAFPGAQAYTNGGLHPTFSIPDGDIPILPIENAMSPYLVENSEGGGGGQFKEKEGFSGMSGKFDAENLTSAGSVTTMGGHATAMPPRSTASALLPSSDVMLPHHGSFSPSQLNASQSYLPTYPTQPQLYTSSTPPPPSRMIIPPSTPSLPTPPRPLNHQAHLAYSSIPPYPASADPYQQNTRGAERGKPGNALPPHIDFAAAREMIVTPQEAKQMWWIEPGDKAGQVLAKMGVLPPPPPKPHGYADVDLAPKMEEIEDDWEAEDGELRVDCRDFLRRIYYLWEPNDVITIASLVMGTNNGMTHLGSFVCNRSKGNEYYFIDKARACNPEGFRVYFWGDRMLRQYENSEFVFYRSICNPGAGSRLKAMLSRQYLKQFHPVFDNCHHFERDLRAAAIGVRAQVLNPHMWSHTFFGDFLRGVGLRS